VATKELAMHQVSARIFVCVSISTAVWACDGSSTSQPPESSREQASEGTPSHGNGKVEVVINHNPRVTDMRSSTGRLASSVPVGLAATATDADDDPITYAWSSDCPGVFDRRDTKEVTYTPGALMTGRACSFLVTVDDGRGGVGTGSLSLSSAIPKMVSGPRIGISSQSTDHAQCGELVALYATATDDSGSALIWTWGASAGDLVDQHDQDRASEIHWRAPMEAGKSWSITATVSNAGGGSASLDFVVAVR
jgi:hypothetical protein